MKKYSFELNAGESHIARLKGATYGITSLQAIFGTSRCTLNKHIGSFLSKHPDRILDLVRDPYGAPPEDINKTEIYAVRVRMPAATTRLTLAGFKAFVEYVHPAKLKLGAGLSAFIDRQDEVIAQANQLKATAEEAHIFDLKTMAVIRR